VHKPCWILLYLVVFWAVFSRFCRGGVGFSVDVGFVCCFFIVFLKWVRVSLFCSRRVWGYFVSAAASALVCVCEYRYGAPSHSCIDFCISLAFFMVLRRGSLFLRRWFKRCWFPVSFFFVYFLICRGVPLILPRPPSLRLNYPLEYCSPNMKQGCSSVR